MRILMRREGAESSIFNAPPSIRVGDARLAICFEYLPYQLDQVLELIRLRVEVIDQKGLELLCGAVGGGKRRWWRWRWREVRGGRGRRINLAKFAVKKSSSPANSYLAPAGTCRAAAWLVRSFGQSRLLSGERGRASEQASARASEREREGKVGRSDKNKERK